jgi:hypothetical protein
VSGDGPAQADAWQANSRTANRYPRYIPRAPCSQTDDSVEALFFVSYLGGSAHSFACAEKNNAPQGLLLEQALTFPPRKGGGRLRLTIMSKGSLGDRGPGCFLLGSSFTHAQVAKAYIERWCRFINL